MNKLILSIIILLLLTSCSMTPPKEEIKLTYQIPTKFHNQDGYKTNKDSLNLKQWWQKFNNKELNNFVDKVINNNLDLKLALQRTKFLETVFNISETKKYPTLAVSGGMTALNGPQASLEMTAAGPVQTVSVESYENYNLKTGLRYEIDFWGKYRSSENAALNELKASKEDQRTLYQTLIARAVILYYDSKSAREEIKLAEENLEIFSYNYQLQKHRYLKGVGKKLNIDLTTQALEETKSKLAAARMSLAKKENQLTILAGIYKKTALFSEQSNLDSTKTDLKVNLQIPSRLLKSRSDIRSAEYKLDAAREQIGIAKADLYPNLAITAGLNLSSLDLADLFTADALTKTIGAEFNHALFTGGAKTTVLKQKKIAYKQALLNYQKIVLNAFIEVEDALVSLKYLKQQLESVEKQKIAAKKILEQREKMYLGGLDSYHNYLEARKSLITSKSGVIKLKNYLLASQVELIKAIGF